jgi:hypothetical protein
LARVGVSEDDIFTIFQGIVAQSIHIVLSSLHINVLFLHAISWWVDKVTFGDLFISVYIIEFFCNNIELRPLFYFLLIFMVYWHFRFSGDLIQKILIFQTWRHSGLIYSANWTYWLKLLRTLNRQHFSFFNLIDPIDILTWLHGFNFRHLQIFVEIRNLNRNRLKWFSFDLAHYTSIWYVF